MFLQKNRWVNPETGEQSRYHVDESIRPHKAIGSEGEIPLNYRIDHGLRLVIAIGQGVLTDSDVFGYQRDVWSRQDVAGYNELVDMTWVTQIALPSADRVRDLAEVAAAMDDKSTRSKFAIVATADVAFGLGRMFQSYREVMEQSTKEVGVFRTMEEALSFPGINGPLSLDWGPR
jgi:hypothetical protein